MIIIKNYGKFLLVCVLHQISVFAGAASKRAGQLQQRLSEIRLELQKFPTFQNTWTILKSDPAKIFPLGHPQLARFLHQDAFGQIGFGEKFFS